MEPTPPACPPPLHIRRALQAKSKMKPKQPAGAPPVHVVFEALRKRVREEVQERIAHASKVAKKGDGFDGLGTPDPSNQNDDNQVTVPDEDLCQMRTCDQNDDNQVTWFSSL